MAALAHHYWGRGVACFLLRWPAFGFALVGLTRLHGRGGLLGAGHAHTVHGGGRGALVGDDRIVVGGYLLFLPSRLAGGGAGARCDAGHACLCLPGAHVAVVWINAHVGGGHQCDLRHPSDDPYRGAGVFSGPGGSRRVGGNGRVHPHPSALVGAVSHELAHASPRTQSIDYGRFCHGGLRLYRRRHRRHRLRGVAAA